MDKLIEAADLIELEMSKLNTRERRCECCGIIVRKNFREFQQHKELEAILRKLRRFGR